MNIFILDENPIVAAQYQCDKHIPKMVLESAQMLCLLLPEEISPYKHAYPHHPCSKWALASRDNYHWLLEHAKELSREYTFRFHKTHACERVILTCETYARKYAQWTNIERTPFAQAMPDEYQDLNAVTAYRSYYLGDKARFAKWRKGRNAPFWWQSCITPSV